MQVRITDGSTHDAHAKVLFSLTRDLVGWVFGDKGYLLNIDKQVFLEREGQLIWAVKPRKPKQAVDWPVAAKKWAKKRSLMELVIGQTKAVRDLEHSRHRSATNAFVNMYASLIAYSFYERKPVAGVNLGDRLLWAAEPSCVSAA